MFKPTVAGCAALLMFAAAAAMPMHAQNRTAAAQAVPPEAASPGSALSDNSDPASADPASAAPPDVMPPAAADTTATPQPVQPARKPAAPKPAAPAVRAPVAAKPAAAKPVVTVKPAPALSIQGKLELVAGQKSGQKQSVDAGEVADGLVYFLPKAGNPKPKPGFFTVRTHSKGFSPSLLVVPAGSTIAFPNRDTVLHNVFSRTPGATFDLGNYGPGQSRQQVFSKPGLITVNCSVHYTMRATVLVMATPYYTRPDRNGRFELTGLPPGAGTLVYWHPRSAAATTQISLPGATVQKQTLIATKPRSDHHAGTH